MRSNIVLTSVNINGNIGKLETEKMSDLFVDSDIVYISEIEMLLPVFCSRLQSDTVVNKH